AYRNELELLVAYVKRFSDLHGSNMRILAERGVGFGDNPDGQEDLMPSIEVIAKLLLRVAIVVRPRPESFLSDHAPAGRLIAQGGVSVRIILDCGLCLKAATFCFRDRPIRGRDGIDF